jgi:hypothetical protein
VVPQTQGEEGAPDGADGICFFTNCFSAVPEQQRYCPAIQQHSCKQYGAQPGWGASEDVHESTMGE